MKTLAILGAILFTLTTDAAAPFTADAQEQLLGRVETLYGPPVQVVSTSRHVVIRQKYGQRGEEIAITLLRDEATALHRGMNDLPAALARGAAMVSVRAEYRLTTTTTERFVLEPPRLLLTIARSKSGTVEHVLKFESSAVDRVHSERVVAFGASEWRELSALVEKALGPSP